MLLHKPLALLIRRRNHVPHESSLLLGAVPPLDSRLVHAAPIAAAQAANHIHGLVPKQRLFLRKTLLLQRDEARRVLLVFSLRDASVFLGPLFGDERGPFLGRQLVLCGDARDFVEIEAREDGVFVGVVDVQDLERRLVVGVDEDQARDVWAVARQRDELADDDAGPRVADEDQWVPDVLVLEEEGKVLGGSFGSRAHC